MPGPLRMKKPRKTQKPPRPLLEPIADDGNTSFARALGSVDFHTRERGVEALSAFLRTKSAVSHLEMRKLWKGLFYCFWHSDKEPVQEELASRLAAILPQLTAEVAAVYFECFMETMTREWLGIDRLRLDKFMMLLRKFIRQLLQVLADSDWDKDTVGKYAAMLGATFKQSDEQPTAGLSYQIADVIVPELLALLKEQGSSIPDRPLRQLLDVFLTVMATTTRFTLIQRIRSSVFEPLLAEVQASEQAGPLCTLDVISLSDFMLSCGGQAGVKSKPRSLLYELSSQFESAANHKRSRPESADTAVDQSSTAPKPKRSKTEATIPIVQAAARDGGAAVGGEHDNAAKLRSLKALPQISKHRVEKQSSISEQSKDATTHSAGDVVASEEGAALLRLAAEKLEAVSSKTASSSDDAAAAAAEPGKTKLRHKAAEAVKRATHRTLAAMTAHRKGKATVKPATPGHPSDTDVSSWFEDSLTTSQKAKPDSLTRSNPSGSKQGEDGPVGTRGKLVGNKGRVKGRAASRPGSPKHVQFDLQQNLIFGDGLPVPEASVRTPENCRPKGSALKRTSKFPGSAPPKKKARKIRSKRPSFTLSTV